MNTVQAIIQLERGEAIPADTPVKVKGYLPCRLATGKPTKSNEIFVTFENGRKMRFLFTQLLYGEEDIKRGYAKA